MSSDEVLPVNHQVHGIEGKGTAIVVLYNIDDYAEIQCLASLLQKRNPDVVVIVLPSTAKMETYSGKELETLVKLITAKMTREELRDAGFIRIQ